MANLQILSNRNKEILTQLSSAYNEKAGPRIGDWLKLPYGLYTRFTHFWDSSIQTGTGSFHLGEGYISYSGGLDSGIAKADLIPTNELKSGSVWIWDKGEVGPGRGVQCEIMFRVFELKEGADTSGIPKIKEHERNEFLKTVETVTRTDGNGRDYTLPVPVLRLQFGPSITDAQRRDIVRKASSATGLPFNLTSHYSQVQPTTRGQVYALEQAFPGKHSFHNGSFFKNTLVFDFV